MIKFKKLSSIGGHGSIHAVKVVIATNTISFNIKWYLAIYARYMN
jgi:hypothetical protein